MKNKTGYGTFDITRQIAKRIQLEWDMVEQPSTAPRFLNFPCAEVPVKKPLRLHAVRTTEKRPLAA